MKRYFGKIDLFALSLRDRLALIACSFYFDLKKKILKKKNPPTHTYSKKVVEDNQTIILRALWLQWVEYGRISAIISLQTMIHKSQILIFNQNIYLIGL